MPGGDRSGPAGRGPKTGRAAGYCSGSGVPGYANRTMQVGTGTGWGSGFRGGRCGAGGRGHRNMFLATGLPGWMRWGNSVSYPQVTESRQEALKQQADALQSELDAVRKQIQEMENHTGS